MGKEEKKAMESIELKKIQNDEHQLNLMQESLSLFEKNWIDLNSLIEILLSLYAYLEHSEELWNEKFYKEVCVLKKIKNNEIKDGEMDNLIKNTVSNLTVLVRKGLNRLFIDKCDAL